MEDQVLMVFDQKLQQRLWKEAMFPYSVGNGRNARYHSVSNPTTNSSLNALIVCPRLFCTVVAKDGHKFEEELRDGFGLFGNILGRILVKTTSSLFDWGVAIPVSSRGDVRCFRRDI